MVKTDLKVTGIPYIDADGRVGDFHAFRHTCATNLIKNGVALAMAQRILRHHDPKLTSNIYTHMSLGDMAAELAKLPDLISARSPEEPQIADAESVSEPMDAGMGTLWDTFSERSNDSLYNSVDEELSFAEELERLYVAMTQQKSPVSSGETGQQYWHPLGDSNPCSQTENLMCWPLH